MTVWMIWVLSSISCNDDIFSCSSKKKQRKNEWCEADLCPLKISCHHLLSISLKNRGCKVQKPSGSHWHLIISHTLWSVYDHFIIKPQKHFNLSQHYIARPGMRDWMLLTMTSLKPVEVAGRVERRSTCRSSLVSGIWVKEKMAVSRQCWGESVRRPGASSFLSVAVCLWRLQRGSRPVISPRAQAPAERPGLEWLIHWLAALPPRHPLLFHLPFLVSL